MDPNRNRTEVTFDHWLGKGLCDGGVVWRSLVQHVVPMGLVPPTLCLGFAPDQAFFFLVRPTGPETIDVEIGYIFHPSALDDPLFDEKIALSDAGVQVFVRQDQDATTKVQYGLNSRFAPRGRYSWQEESHVQFNRWLAKRYRAAWPAPVPVA